MLRITKHIERLLLVHDCVIIPGIGGFVLQTISATYEKNDHSFRPMRKEIVFNTSLQHNDGLLPESYMQSYHVDFRKAQSMVEEDICEMKSSIQQFGKVSVEKIGSLTVGEEGQYIFHPGKADTFNVDYYGLSSFHFPVLPVVERDDNGAIVTEKKKDIFYIPISMRFIRSTVAVAAAIVLFLLISTPVKDVKQSAYTASMIPTELLSIKAPAVIPEETVLEEAVANPAPVQTDKTILNKKTYHIIIGSFPNEEKANEYISAIDKSQFSDAGIVLRDGRYRVYADKFDNRKDAESFLTTIRNSEKHKEAWMFISK